MHELNNCYFPFLLFKIAEQTRRGIRSPCTFVNLVRALSRHAFFSVMAWGQRLAHICRLWPIRFVRGLSEPSEKLAGEPSTSGKSRHDLKIFWLKHSQSATSYWTRLDGVHPSIRPARSVRWRQRKEAVWVPRQTFPIESDWRSGTRKSIPSLHMHNGVAWRLQIVHLHLLQGRFGISKVHRVSRACTRQNVLSFPRHEPHEQTQWRVRLRPVRRRRGPLPIPARHAQLNRRRYLDIKKCPPDRTPATAAATLIWRSTGWIGKMPRALCSGKGSFWFAKFPLRGRDDHEGFEVCPILAHWDIASNSGGVKFWPARWRSTGKNAFWLVGKKKAKIQLKFSERKHRRL